MSSIHQTRHYFIINLLLVRQKVKEIINLLQDNERLRQERKNAKKTRDKYIGVSSNDSRWGK